MDTLNEKLKALWQTYPYNESGDEQIQKEQHYNDEEFWQAYEQLRDSTPIQKAKIASAVPKPTSALKQKPSIKPLPFKLPANLKVTPDKKAWLETQDYAEYDSREVDVGTALAFMGIFASFILILNFGVSGINVLFFFALLGSLLIVVARGIARSNQKIFENFSQTYIKVDKDEIFRMTSGARFTAVRYDEVSFIAQENFGLILKVKNKRGKEVDALAIPVGLEHYETLKEFLYQHVRKNNGINITG